MWACFVGWAVPTIAVCNGWAEPTLRWDPEQNLALHRFNDVAKPGVANARPTAVDLGGDGGLVVERWKLIFVNGHAKKNCVSFFTADLGRLLNLDDLTAERLSWVTGKDESD